MRRSLLNKLNLPKPLRQALVLITLLLLPSAAWGERYTTGSSTGSYNNEYNTWTVNDASGEPITNSWSITATSTLPTITYNTETGLNIAFSTNAKQANLNFNNNNYGAIRKLSIKFKEIPDGINPYSVTMKKDESTNVSWTSSTSGNTYTYIVNPASSWESITIFLNYTGSQEDADLTIESISFLTGDDGVTYYDLSVSDTEVTNLNASDITSSNIVPGSNGKVSFTPANGNTPATLTLKSVTINSDIISSLEALTINLEDENTINGQILVSEETEENPGSLTFSGDGSLNISYDDGVPIWGFQTPDLGDFKILSSSTPCIQWNSTKKGFVGYNDDWAHEFTITKADVSSYYPIWVFYNGSYKQITTENKTNVLGKDFVYVSYDNTSTSTPTLTLKAASLTPFNSEGTSGIVVGPDFGENLNVHVIGYNEITNSVRVMGNTEVTYSTNSVLPGAIESNNKLEYYASFDGAIYCFTRNNDYVDTDNGENSYIFTTGLYDAENAQQTFFASYAKKSDNLVTIKPRSGKTMALWPSSYEIVNDIKKIYLQFDKCTDLDATVQIKGLVLEGSDLVVEEEEGVEVNYSNAIPLNSAENGILEIPLTKTITADNFELFFSSDKDDFSMILLSVGINKIKTYELTVGGVTVTSENANDIQGDNISGGKISFTPADNTTTPTKPAILTLTNTEIHGGVEWEESDDLKIVISGTNSITNTEGNGIEASEAYLTFAKAENADNCDLTITSKQSSQDEYYYPIISGNDGGSFIDQGQSGLYFITANDNKTFVTTDGYALKVAGVQVHNKEGYIGYKSNILNDARNTMSYDSGSNTLTLKSADAQPAAHGVVIGSGVSTLNVHVIGYNKLGHGDYFAFTSEEDCTVTLTEDETFSGILDCSDADAIFDSKVTVMYKDEAISNTGDDGYRRIYLDKPEGAYVSLFGSSLVLDDNALEGYPYTSGEGWAFANAQNNVLIPRLLSTENEPYTVAMRPNNESTIGSATKLSLLYDWEGNVPTGDITATIQSIDGSTNYSSSITLPSTGGIVEIPITGGLNVLANDFKVNFSSNTEFQFALLATRLDYTYENYLEINGEIIDISQDATINSSSIFNGTVTFTASTKTVTFTDASIDYTGYTVVTGIEDLKVNLVGENSVNTGDGESGAFHAITESASIDLEGEGSMTITTLAESPFTDFGEDKITYNKLVCWKSGDENWTIAPPSAPEIKGVMYEGSLAVEISKKYKDGDIYYKIDYAGETEDISERTKYEDSFIMAAPGIVTAWVEVNDAITDEVIGKYFGYIDTPYTIAKGSTKETTIYPLIAEEDGFGISYSSQNESIATFANGTITGVAAGTTQVRSSLTTTNSSLEYTILNQKTTGVDVSDSYIITLDVTVQELIDESTFTSGQNYGTFYNTSTETYKVPEGLVAYVVTGVTEGSITIAETTILPPNAPVLLYRTNLENATNYTFTQATASDGTFPEGNILEYAYEAVSTDASSKLYVLYNGMFVKVTSGTDIAAKHCYLDLGNTVANTRGFYTIGGGEGTTAIQKVNCEKLADGEWYTLQGQRVAKPAKGLYILNGKKVVVK